jgi:hypothetical protein
MKRAATECSLFRAEEEAKKPEGSNLLVTLKHTQKGVSEQKTFCFTTLCHRARAINLKITLAASTSLFCANLTSAKRLTSILSTKEQRTLSAPPSLKYLRSHKWKDDAMDRMSPRQRQNSKLRGLLYYALFFEECRASDFHCNKRPDKGNLMFPRENTKDRFQRFLKVTYSKKKKKAP